MSDWLDRFCFTCGAKMQVHRDWEKPPVMCSGCRKEQALGAAAARAPSPSSRARELPSRRGGRVFIVHGHDEAAKEAVARIVERLGLTPVILHEQADRGRTVIEKFETHTEADFAVAILSPDDRGHAKDKPEEVQDRPRQNVLLELGYFLGRLGRGRVCVLHKGAVEIPSDYHGVCFVPLDAGGGWRLLLARELRSSGLEIDVNRVLEA